MKILAIEQEIEGVSWDNTAAVLLDEATHVYGLQQQGILRETYFNEAKCAVLVFEAESKLIVQKLLANSPLVQAGLITFSITELRPYTGLDRLMK